MSFSENEQSRRDLVIYRVESAANRGKISPEVRALMLRPDVVEAAAEAEGVAAEDIEEGNILLLTLLLDTSGSMDKHAGVVRTIINRLLESARQSKGFHYSPRNIHVGMHGLEELIQQYNYVTDVPGLDEENYRPNLGRTLLYNATAKVLGIAANKAYGLRNDYKEVLSTVLLITDGFDNDLSLDKPQPEQIAETIAKMHAEGGNLVAALGIGAEQNFRPTFRAMGIPNQLILTTDSDDESLARALTRVENLVKEASRPGKLPLLLKSGFEGISDTPSK